jgi:hypothetical protein
MKKLISLMFVSLVMLFSCSKDILTDENPELKRAKVPVPYKGEMCMTYNYDVPLMPVAGTPVLKPSGEVLIPKLYLSGAAWLTGHATHMGEFIPEQTHMTGLHAELDMAALFNDKKVILVAEYEAIFTGDNGDHIDVLSQIRIDATDPSNRTITGVYQVTGGSGNFENVTGSGVLNGILPCWSCEGTLEYPR